MSLWDLKGDMCHFGGTDNPLNLKSTRQIIWCRIYLKEYGIHRIIIVSFCSKIRAYYEKLSAMKKRKKKIKLKQINDQRDMPSLLQQTILDVEPMLV